jgi:PKD repeat protein
MAIGINTPPTASFTATVSNDSAITLNTSTMATSYSWNSGTNSNWVSSTNPVFVYGVSGTYVITLATAGPCGVDTTQQSVMIVVPVSNESLLEELTLGIYPNPSEGKFRVELPNELQNQELLVQITDLAGKIVYSGQCKEQKELTLELNASAGIYLLQLNGAGKFWKGKVVVR